LGISKATKVTTTTTVSGNLLGAPEAEVDALLDEAFLETGDYKALTESTDYNFVVGRRGTGKSALFRKVREHFASEAGVLVRAEAPFEYETLDLQQTLSVFTSDYGRARSATRVAWRLHLLCLTIESLERNYKLSRSGAHGFFAEYRKQHSVLFAIRSSSRCAMVIRSASATVNGEKPDESRIPGLIASHFQIEQLQQAVRQALEDTKNAAVVLFDGLDEGWLPSPIATSVLGGLALAISDLAAAKIGIHCTAFIRDNIFRALAHFDPDFSRHIEGHTLRLKWNPESLFTLVTKRLRVALKLGHIESDVKVWNRFAHRDLQDRSGFELSLRHTLYRPRDTLVLLNLAYRFAKKGERSEIIDSDLEEAARTISEDRLRDLLKEYDAVLPGLGLFVSIFRNGPATGELSRVIEVLDSAISSADYGQSGAGDFALFASGSEAAMALYSVGFFGLQSGQGERFRFCHDGSTSGLDTTRGHSLVLVHPCYWQALSLETDTAPEEVAVQIDDEVYTKGADRPVKDLRLKLLGQIVEQLPRLPLGRDGASEFEDWVFRTVRILFGNELSNFELKPNPGGVQQRDIVATNLATRGFWKRILDDYETRQTIFEVKNFNELKEENFRQVLSYTGRDYGRFAAIVTRSEHEGLSPTERGWLREMHFQHQRVVFVIPATILARCVSKLRTADKYDYTEQQLGRRMDTFVRNYLSLKQERSYRSRRNRSVKLRTDGP